MAQRTLFIDGIAFWSPTLNGWDVARAAFRGEPAPDSAQISAQNNAPALARPAPAAMAANERRRASDSVLVALEVASLAVAASGHAAKDLASVFTSAHGDLPITDALCKTLAADPLLLSPLRFHHSVHNAASGYWAIASGCTAASTALAGFKLSFANGLLEAASQCTTEGTPRLLVGFDTEAVGPLASVNRSRGLLGVALVLAPARSARSLFEVRWDVTGLERAHPEAALPPPVSARVPTAPRSAAARALASNAMAAAVPLFEALADSTPQALALALGPVLHLHLDLVPIVTTGPSPVAA
jgi:Beta-ketoacyl synthase, N-terminal domain